MNGPDKSKTFSDTPASPEGGFADWSLQNALESDLGRMLPRTMRRLAIQFTKGRSIEQIAAEEGMDLSTAKGHVQYAAFTLKCRPPSFNATPSQPPTKRSTQESDNKKLGSRNFMTRAKCESCKKPLEADDERVFLSPIWVDYRSGEEEKYEFGHVAVPYLSSRALYYCLDCIHSVEEFRMPNPWFISEEDVQRFARSLEEKERLEQQQVAAKDHDLAQSLAAADMRDFNKAMPTTAGAADWLAHSAPMSSITASIVAHVNNGGDGFKEADVADAIASDLPPGSQLLKMASGIASRIAPGAAQSCTNANQRRKLSEYLNSPSSRGKLRPRAREAAKLWLDGTSQGDIAKKMGMDQSSVSRLIKAAQKEANSIR